MIKECKQITALHAVPKKWIPEIIKNGFKHTKDLPNHASQGRGGREDDLFFFEKETRMGARSSINWWKDLWSHRKLPMGIVEVEVESCKHLGKEEMIKDRDAIIEKGAIFIAKTLKQPTLNDHFRGKVEQYLEVWVGNPLGFLRKMGDYSAISSDDPLIGDVMKSLGYDTADGFVNAHQESKDLEYRNAPISEFVVTNPKKISNIHEVEPEELCERAYIDDVKARECKTMVKKLKNEREIT
jgi:hypothetical protein